MRKLFAAWLIVGLAGATLPAADEPVKVAIDPAKAGPDFAIQGEYVGVGADKSRLGAEVVARGNGNFMVNFLPGGLRGEGGDYGKHIEGSAKTDAGKVTVKSKDGKWTAIIDAGKMIGKSAEGRDFTLERVSRKSKTLGEKPPTGAVVLFDGGNADAWDKGKLVDGNLLGSDISSKKTFQDHKVHLEFRLSFMPFAGGQGRSNSGVYLQHRHEVQVLDSFGLKGANNECGGIYGQTAPLVNLCFPPLTWQTYDIDYIAAKFDKDGKKLASPIISVWHNGVLVHDKVELKGQANAKPGPLHLQGHGGQVQYRNIWVVETTR